jgi:uncharacterized protein
MRETARQLGSEYVCLHVDLQKAMTAADAVVELSVASIPYARTWQKVKGVFKSILAKAADRVESLQLDQLRITLRSGTTAGNWQAKGDQVFATLAEAEKPVVIFFDEVPILVNRLLKGDDYKITPERRQDTDAFMSWLRENSIRHKGKVRMVVTGSIGLEPVLRQAQLNATLNTFSPFDLGPWNRPTALGCLEALANQYGIVFLEGTRELMVEKLGCCVPHHVQMFFDHVHDEAKLGGREDVDHELVERAYQERMLSARGHAELSQLEERLHMVMGPHEHPLALDLLTEAAITGALTSDGIRLFGGEYGLDDQAGQETLREVMGVLLHDGYLHKRPEGYVFVSRLLRDWWKARFGDLFIPAAQRRA